MTGSSTSAPSVVVQSIDDLARELLAGERVEVAAAALPLARANAAQARSTARPPSIVAREAVVMPVSSSWLVSTTTLMRAGSSAQLRGRELAEDRVGALAHLGPGVEERQRRRPPSGRSTARPYSVRPLPMPVFLAPQAMPA